mgnify:CR=1 FL=1
MLTFRFATTADAPLLAYLNHALIQDEGHRNPMTLTELEERMAEWLTQEYCALIFSYCRTRPCSRLISVI